MSKAFLNEFIAMNIAIVTISDTRNTDTDTSGKLLTDLAIKDGHKVIEKVIIKDSVDDIKILINSYLNRPEINIIITTGGTGFSKRDNTKLAVHPLIEKHIDGFGELFRFISYQEIGTSSMQSNAFAGFIKGKVIFCIPGSTGACDTAYNKILTHQLNSTTKPCNFAAMITLNIT